MTKDEATVLATINNMTSSLERGDIEAVMSTYGDGASIMFEPGEVVNDTQSAREIFSEMSQLNPNVSYPHGDEVYIAGDTAIHIAPWKMTGTAPDGSQIVQGGLSVAVLRKYPDGQWKMVIDNPYSGRLLPD